MKIRHVVLIGLLSAFALYAYNKETPKVPDIVEVYKCDYMEVTQKNNSFKSIGLDDPIIFSVHDNVVRSGELYYQYNTKDKNVRQYKLPDVEEYIQIPIDNQYDRVQLTKISPYSSTEYSCKK